MTRERYFAWIRMAQKSNVNMIRVWGGGYYETEDFWDACDEHGIMIWQDYMLACGYYPIHSRFLESIRKEAELQTIRLPRMCSIGLIRRGVDQLLTTRRLVTCINGMVRFSSHNSQYVTLTVCSMAWKTTCLPGLSHTFRPLHIRVRYAWIP